MSPGSSLHIVKLSPQSKEYQTVFTKFQATMQPSVQQLGLSAAHSTLQPIKLKTNSPNYNSIVRIERIQNLVLYGQYMAKKRVMDKTNPSGHQNEMSLFHGTSADTCLKINQQGFNRSFSGRNGKD